MTDVVLADVDEDFVCELALARGCSEAEARGVLREALVLTGPLSLTWSRLAAGLIGIRHARTAVDLLGDAAPDVAAEVQRRVLPGAAGTTAVVFRDRLRRQLYRVDAEARERRRRQAAATADVRIWATDEGLSTLGIDLPTARAHAARSAVDGYARMLRADGDTRPIGVLRAEAAWDLLMRPWDTTRPPVTATLTIYAALPALRPDGDPRQSQQPAEIDGQVVSAAQCRKLLRDLDLLQLGTPPLGGSVLVAVADPATGETIAVATSAELKTGAGGPGLCPPPDTPAYPPTAAQKRFVQVRDRRCRMPGCRTRVGRCDLDHGRPYDRGGPTACRNLCCLCTRHHRIKTHAHDWTFHLLADGTLRVRTPAGITRTTRPPGRSTDPEPHPPWLDDLAPADPSGT